MKYAVKELFYTIQGEGINAGKPAIFCRFSGCNLWSGREVDRAKAVCSFCDTNFVGTDGLGGGVFDENELAGAASRLWPDSGDTRFVVFTGGEPLLQLDQILISAFKAAGFKIAIETNGTLKAPNGIDWICVSPKGKADLVVLEGDELKFVYPQESVDPRSFESLAFNYFLIQPMDGTNKKNNTDLAIDFCLSNPKWRLSLQLHKIVGVQ
jgi:7-carboxy-7-deazaguanine synthase